MKNDKHSCDNSDGLLDDLLSISKVYVGLKVIESDQTSRYSLKALHRLRKDNS